MDTEAFIALAEFCFNLLSIGAHEYQHPLLMAVLDVNEHDVGLAFYGEVSHDDLLRRVVPPPDLVALVLHASGWVAPLPEGADGPDGICEYVPYELRPSRHPQRRRVEVTTLLGAGFQIVSVMQAEGDLEPTIMTGECVGRIPEALQVCWLRGLLAAA